ncbi:MAG: hypothetical protein ACT4OK_11630 [Gemmobacter sp.]
MSNPDSFIEEVTEEVRRDRLFALFRKYGWIAVVAILAVVGGAAWTEWQKARARATAQAFGDGLLAALDADTPEARRAALTAVPADDARRAVQFLLAASDPGQDRVATLAALDALIADPGAGLPYRDLATLRRVILMGSDLPAAERRAALDPLATPGRAFRPLAVEQLAYLALETGDRAAAVTALSGLVEDQEAPPGLRRRASQMLLALGEKPDPADAASPPGGDVAQD